MKYPIYKIAIILITFIAVSCDNDDSTPSINNEFTIQAVDYETPNAYLIFDDSSPYGDAFFIVLLDGTLIEDNVNGISTSTNTRQGIALSVNHGGDVLTEQQINIGNATYTLNKDNTVIFTNASNFTDTFVQNGTTYGEVDLSSSSAYYIENSGSGTLIIDYINIDFTNRKGTLNCSYNLIDDTGISITGQFNGVFEILNGF